MSLCQVLVNHISIRLYASQEISQKRFNRTATTAIIPVIVVEEISDILLFVHQSPNVLLIVMTNWVPSPLIFILTRNQVSSIFNTDFIFSSLDFNVERMGRNIFAPILRALDRVLSLTVNLSRILRIRSRDIREYAADKRHSQHRQTDPE